MNDILPPDSARWEWFEDTVRAADARATATGTCARRSSSRRALFVRGLGEVTDIVEKEMYSFVDAMNGDALTLRPEGTAGVVRAMVEHTRCTTAASGCTTSGRCSATSARSAAATASSTRSASRRSASPARMSTPR